MRGCSAESQIRWIRNNARLGSEAKTCDALGGHLPHCRARSEREQGNEDKLVWVAHVASVIQCKPDAAEPLNQVYQSCDWRCNTVVLAQQSKGRPHHA
ncbi:hypothetical protein D3C83_06670 [compost metagenome]